MSSHKTRGQGGLDRVDICIIGAGVIGLAIAKQLASNESRQQLSIIILERDTGFGRHTSSRNSEVIHAGIYYAPGSLKATLCLRGKQLLYKHCDDYRIDYRQLGKYIVAKQEQEPELLSLAKNAADCGVEDLRWVSRQQLQQDEPEVTAGLALFSPSTGILDSHNFMQSLLHLAQNQGVEYAPYTRLESIEWSNQAFNIASTITSGRTEERYDFQSSIVINCAGLEASAVGRSIITSQAVPVPQTYFCKGDYFSYTLRSPLRHLVYPLPDKNQTGLGIHATLDLSGQLRFGPDTEYVESIFYDINPNKAGDYARAISHYFPAITASNLTPAYAGIRPKLAPPGKPAEDFYIQDGKKFAVPGLIQLFGIESPGLTASLAIGEYVSNMVRDLVT